MLSTSKDSAALKVLNDFKNADVEVLACGLCVDFYGVKSDVPKEQERFIQINADFFRNK